MSDREYLRFTWNFVIAGTDETAMTGLAFANAILPGSSSAAALAEVDMAVLGLATINAMDTLMSDVGVQWADYSFLTNVRLAAVGTDGLEIGDAKIYEDLTTRQGGAQQVLPQASIVVSTRSTFSTGAANFGRMYLPHTRMNLPSGLPASASATVGSVATAAQAFVLSVQTALNIQTTAIYEPFIITHKVGAASKEILQIQVGNVTDTQRRRRRQLPEVYEVRSIP